MVNFFNMPIVYLALSLMIWWALFAILCSLVFEFFAQLKAERGRFMKHYMLQQLHDRPNGINWGSLLYLHGTIDLLSRDSTKPTNEISSKLFAEAMVDVVGKSHLVQTRVDSGLKLSYQSPILANFEAATRVLNPSDVVTFLKQSLHDADIRGTVGETRNESQIYAYLLENLQCWHNEFSQRLSWWYKKESKYKLFWVGTILGLLLNVDSIQLFTFFKDNPDSQQVLQNYYQQNQSLLQAYQEKIDMSEQGTKEFLNEVKFLSKVLDSVKTAASLPVGFDHNVLYTFEGYKSAASFACYKVNSTVKVEGDKVNCDSYVFMRVVKNILLKFFGVLITGLAVSFGAPFWFDLLRKAYKKP